MAWEALDICLRYASWCVNAWFGIWHPIFLGLDSSSTTQFWI